MVTKSIPKNKEFDQTQVAQRLEGLVKSVAKRRVFVIAKNSEFGFDLIDYVTKKPVVTNIATKFLADLLCSHCNNVIHHAGYFVKAQKTFDRYHKLFNDSTIYRHIIYNCQDDTQADIARMRLLYTRQQMEQLILTLKLPL